MNIKQHVVLAECVLGRVLRAYGPLEEKTRPQIWGISS